MTNIRFLTLGLSLLLLSCTTEEPATDNPVDVFDELWQWVDANYIYFDLKQVDWQETYDTYRPLISEGTSDEDLFETCNDMLLTLRDAHNWLRRPSGFAPPPSNALS